MEYWGVSRVTLANASSIHMHPSIAHPIGGKRHGDCRITNNRDRRPGPDKKEPLRADGEAKTIRGKRDT